MFITSSQSCLSFQDSEDVMFNFVARNRVSDQQQPGQQTNTFDVAPRKRPRADQTIMSYIKKPVKGGTRVIKIEIYDADNFLKSDDSTCKCEAETCVQYVANSALFDDIYVATKGVIKKIQAELEL